jgi:hypothetical protein
MARAQSDRAIAIKLTVLIMSEFNPVNAPRTQAAALASA